MLGKQKGRFPLAVPSLLAVYSLICSNSSAESVLWLGKRSTEHVIKGVKTSPVTASGPESVSLDIPEPWWKSPRMFSQLMLESDFEFQGNTSD